MILDGILVGLGIAIGVLAIAAPVTLAVVSLRALQRTRSAWWLRARLAIRRARPTTRER
jgi:hypothetical protein